MEKIDDINKKTYSTSKAIEIYSTNNYIRPYEEYVFDKYFTKGCRVLDLGCGTGRTTKIISDRGVEVIGLDFVENFVNKGKELYPELDLRHMDAARLGFKENSFDIVFFSNQGIDYTSRREEVFKEAYRVLKPEGLFIYTFHNSVCLPRTKRTLLDFFINIKDFRLKQHIRTERHDNGSLKITFNNIWSEKADLQKVGFKLLKVLSNNKTGPRTSHLYVGLLERWPMFVCLKK